MDFSLNDEQKMMIDTVRRFIAEQLKPLEDEIENSGFLAKDKAQAVHDKAKELGLRLPDPPRFRQCLRAAAALQGRAGSARFTAA